MHVGKITTLDPGLRRDDCLKVVSLKIVIPALDPGLRRDDCLKVVGLKIVIPAQAGIQCRLSFSRQLYGTVH